MSLRMMTALLMLMLMLMLPLSSAQAIQRNDLPSCYAQSGIAEFKQPSSGRLLTVIIDQTLTMPEDIQRAAWGQIDRFVHPGDQVRLYTFSALIPGQYIRLLFTGTLETPIPDKQRNSVSMNRLRNFDRCMNNQRSQYTKTMGRQFVSALREASNQHPRSEIMFALREIASDINQAKPAEHVVFLISDMLEHSDSTSFYARGSMRNLSINQEIAKAEANQLFAKLDKSRIYVTGGGLATDNLHHANRSGAAMDTLEDFWRQYFHHSGSVLAGFGKPLLNLELR